MGCKMIVAVVVVVVLCFLGTLKGATPLPLGVWWWMKKG